MTKIFKEDGVNLLIRTLFGEWPREDLAQIYTGELPGRDEFCGHYFEIGVRERRLGRLFFALKTRAMPAISGISVTKATGTYARRRKSHLSLAFSRLISLIVDKGYWDLLFQIRPSNALIKFVLNFKPDIIYTQGYSLSFTRLALELARQLKIPLFYFPMDDWHSSLFAGSLVHHKVNKIATRVAREASIRFALGPKMAETLSARYGVSFECLYHADCPERFNISENIKRFAKGSKDKLVIGYAGSLYLGRLTAIKDLLSVCQLLGRPFTIDIYCQSIPQDTPQELLHSPYITFQALPEHNELPKVLSGCDVLFIPESFDLKYKGAIELSLSTKSHLYMFSRRPILIYGPPWSGTIDYAKRFGWGIVVDKRSIDKLSEGLKIALGDQADEFAERAYSVAMMNHNVNNLRNLIKNRVYNIIKVKKSGHEI